MTRDDAIGTLVLRLAKLQIPKVTWLNTLGYHAWPLGKIYMNLYIRIIQKHNIWIDLKNMMWETYLFAAFPTSYDCIVSVPNLVPRRSYGWWYSLHTLPTCRSLTRTHRAAYSAVMNQKGGSICFAFMWVHIPLIPPPSPRQKTIAPAFPPALAQELTFIEMFAGEGNCWRGVRAENEYSVGVDLKYMQVAEGKENPFDICSTSGLPFLSMLGVTNCVVKNYHWDPLPTQSPKNIQLWCHIK